jgi:hypothetical protein
MWASMASLKKLLEIVKQPRVKWGDVRRICEELRGRLIDETESMKFFMLAPAEVEYYADPRKGWGLCITRFPETVDDMEEAWKCFALSRYAAAVFHSVQIVEHGLIDLGVFLKVKDPKSGWTAVFNALDAAIKKPKKIAQDLNGSILVSWSKYMGLLRV